MLADAIIMTLHRLPRVHGNRRDWSYASNRLTSIDGGEHNRITMNKYYHMQLLRYYNEYGMISSY